jgi:aminoglycoside 6-adenylyltransferase
MSDLFRETAIDVAAHFGYQYPYEDDNRVTAYCQQVQKLPRDAE